MVTPRLISTRGARAICPACGQVEYRMNGKCGPMRIRQRGDYRQSALVLGTAQLGGAYGIANRTGVPGADAVERILATARELGVTHLDTARAYGESEQRIGAVDHRLAVITKIAPGGDVRASIDASRAALRATGPWTILLHRAADAARWPELRNCLEAGEADRIGVSVQ